MDNVVLVSLPCLVILLISTQEASSDSSNCFNDYCFTYSGSDVTRSFDGARTWCANNNSSSLAVVNNKSSQDALYGFLSSSKISFPIYVNAKVNPSTESTWYLISEQTFPDTVLNQSNDGNKMYQFYAYLRKSPQTFAIWASISQEPKSYICSYKNFAGNVPPNTSYSYNSGSVYIKYENETLNWFEARNRCYLNGGDLATFSRLSEFNTNWLNSSFSYWIGIRWIDWRWENIEDDNQEVIYTNWSNGRPNDVSLTCVCVDETSSHKWTDCDCTTPRSFVCSKYIGTSTVTSPTTILNEPTPFQDKMSVSQTTENNSKTLAIGVGVGVGGGVLIILVIVVIIIVVRKRKSRAGTAEGKPRKEPKESKKSTETPAKQPTANTAEYAEILAASQPGPRGSAKKTIVYTTPEFVETK